MASNNLVSTSNWYRFGIKALVHGYLRYYFRRLTVGKRDFVFRGVIAVTQVQLKSKSKNVFKVNGKRFKNFLDGSLSEE